VRFVSFFSGGIITAIVKETGKTHLCGPVYCSQLYGMQFNKHQFLPPVNASVHWGIIIS
jgi:hypothetical protein